MKKIFMSMAAMLVALSASAQVYVGGGVGIGSQKVGSGDSKMSYKFVPEIGYSFNKNWDAGLSVGWTGTEGDTHTFEIAPYARYTFMQSKLVNLFLEGTVGYGHIGGNGADIDVYEFGIKPGLTVNLSDHVAFVTKVGFLGYQQSGDGAGKVKKWGFDLDGTDVTFGLNYKF